MGRIVSVECGDNKDSFNMSKIDWMITIEVAALANYAPKLILQNGCTHLLFIKLRNTHTFIAIKNTHILLKESIHLNILRSFLLF